MAQPSTFKKFTLTGILLLGLVGCATTPPPAPEPEPTNLPEPPPGYSDAEVATLLEQARRAMVREHLTFPKRGSAYEIYTDILAKNPGSEAATRGLESIVEQYIQLSLSALDRRQFASARSMLARARLVLPEHPSIEPTERQLRLIQEAHLRTVKLDESGSDPDIATALAQIASIPDGYQPAGCRYRIWASTDAQGRRIYRILTEQTHRRSNSSHRLRAQMSLRRPAGVERLCFAEAG